MIGAARAMVLRDCDRRLSMHPLSRCALEVGRTRFVKHSYLLPAEQKNRWKVNRIQACCTVPLARHSSRCSQSLRARDKLETLRTNVRDRIEPVPRLREPAAEAEPPE